MRIGTAWFDTVLLKMPMKKKSLILPVHPALCKHNILKDTALPSSGLLCLTVCVSPEGVRETIPSSLKYQNIRQCFVIWGQRRVKTVHSHTHTYIHTQSALGKTGSKAHELQASQVIMVTPERSSSLHSPPSPPQGALK